MKPGAARGRKLSLVVGGVGLAAVGAGVLLGVRAGNVEDTADPLDAELDRRSRRLQSNLAYGAAGLAIPIAIALWIEGAPGPSGSGVAITPRLDSMRGLEVAVRFSGAPARGGRAASVRALVERVLDARDAHDDALEEAELGAAAAVEDELDGAVLVAGGLAGDGEPRAERLGEVGAAGAAVLGADVERGRPRAW